MTGAPEQTGKGRRQTSRPKSRISRPLVNSGSQDRNLSAWEEELATLWLARWVGGCVRPTPSLSLPCVTTRRAVSCVSDLESFLVMRPRAFSDTFGTEGVRAPGPGSPQFTRHQMHKEGQNWTEPRDT